MGDLISREAVNGLIDELARAISDEKCNLQRGRKPGIIMADILSLPSVEPERKAGKIDRHGIPDMPTVPPMPQRAETPERPLPLKEETSKKGMMQIETINIDNDTSKIEKQLEGIKKELHTLNEVLKHWSRR